MRKYTVDEINDFRNGSNFGFRVLMLLIFLIIFCGTLFDNNLLLKEKIIKLSINIPFLLFCFVIGSKFQKRYLAKRIDKMELEK